MRLLNAHTLKLHTFYGEDIPPYAILSHTWLRDDEEVTFAAITASASAFVLNPWHQLPGAKKIQYTCQQAADDGLNYAWIDTCCIDKTNSVELSEAINSMFKWYQRAKVCYAYLADIRGGDDAEIARSRWWTRAWTLQELLAPAAVHFYDKWWQPLGTKVELTDIIVSRSNIDVETLREPYTMFRKSVAQRMSWAAKRQATRAEDEAYSLLGIFEVNLTMQYGEGRHAFLRLQEMILQKSNDQSLFAWGLSPDPIEATLIQLRQETPLSVPRDLLTPNTFGMFTELPLRFLETRSLEFHSTYAPSLHTGQLNGPFRISLLIADIEDCLKLKRPISRGGLKGHIGILPCGHADHPDSMVGIFLEEWSPGRFLRQHIAPGVWTFLVDCHSIPKLDERTIWVDDLSWYLRHQHNQGCKVHNHRTVKVELELPTVGFQFRVMSQDWTFDQVRRVLEQYNVLGKARLDLELDRLKEQDVLEIAVELEPEERDGLGLMNDKVEITRRATSEDRPWITDYEFDPPDLDRSAWFGDIRVEIETRQVYTHMVSCLRIQYRLGGVNFPSTGGVDRRSSTTSVPNLWD